MAFSPSNLQAEYRRTLFMAREAGFTLTRQSLERIQRALDDANRRLSKEWAETDSPVTKARAEMMRAQIGAMLEEIRATQVKAIEDGILGTAEAVTELHKRTVMRLTKSAGMSAGDQARIVARLDLVPVRAVAVLNARRENAANFQTLVRRNMRDAVPAVDRVISAGIVQGLSASRLAKDIGRILANGPTSVNGEGYGLSPSQVTGLATVRSDAKRIAVSEINNTHREANAEALTQAGIVTAAKWQPSGRHAGLPSSPDICDYLALADLFDYGPGYYPPEAWPHAGHPHCACTQGGPVQYRTPGLWTRPKGGITPANDPADLRKQPDFVQYLSEKERRRMFETVRDIIPRPKVRPSAIQQRTLDAEADRAKTLNPITPTPTIKKTAKELVAERQAAATVPATKVPDLDTFTKAAKKEGRDYRKARDKETGFTPAESYWGAQRKVKEVTGADVSFNTMQAIGPTNVWGKPFRGEKKAIEHMNEIAGEIAWLKHEFPNMPRRIYDRVVITDTARGRSTLGLAEGSPQYIAVSNHDKAPQAQHNTAVWEERNGRRWGNDRPGTARLDNTRHEVAHGLTYRETLEGWRRTVQTLMDNGTIVDDWSEPGTIRHVAGMRSDLGRQDVRSKWFQKHVSEYSGVNDTPDKPEWEEIAEVFSMVTRRGYKAGTLPKELEEFIENFMLGGRRDTAYQKQGNPVPMHPRLGRETD